MTIESGVIALAQAVGADVKALNLKVGDLSQLTTTAKNNLVAAINEAAASGGGGGGPEFDELVSAVAGIPYQYTVYKSGGVIVVRKRSGFLLGSFSSAHQAVQAAIDDNPGRTHLQSIALMDDLIATAAVDLKSHTLLYFDGLYTLNAAIYTNGAFRNNNPLVELENIVFCGSGTIDGGCTSHVVGAGPSMGIYANNIKKLRIRDLTVQNTNTHNIDAMNCNDVKVIGVTASNAGDDNVTMMGTTNFEISGCTLSVGRSDFPSGGGFTGSSCIEIEDGAGLGIITNNTCFDNTVGVHCIVDNNPGVEFDLFDLNISNNNVQDMRGNGISLLMQKPATYVFSKAVVSGNVINRIGTVNAGTAGIAAKRVNDLQLSNNIVDGQGYSAANVSGYALTNCDRPTLIGNVSRNATLNGFNITGGKDVMCHGLTVYNPGKVGGNSNDRAAVRVFGSTNNFQLHGITATDDRTGAEIMSLPVAFGPVTGHIVVQGVNGTGATATGISTTGVAMPGGTKVIGATATGDANFALYGMFNQTNNSVRAAT